MKSLTILSIEFKQSNCECKHMRIEALEHKQDEAKTKLQELKTAGDEAWEAVKAGAEKAWAEVKTAYHDAASRFK